MLKDKKERLEEVNNKVKGLIEEDEREQKTFDGEMEDLQTKMDVIQNRIKEVTNENEILNKRIQTRNEDAEKKQQEKQNLCQEVDELKKEIISFEKRLNKLMTRYEETCSTTGSGRGQRQPKNRFSGKRKGKAKNKPDDRDSLQYYDAGSYISQDADAKSKKHKGSHLSHSTKHSIVDGDSGSCKN